MFFPCGRIQLWTLSSKVSASTSHSVPEGWVNETVLSQRFPLLSLILLVWVTLSPSQFAALMNLIWVSCVSILFVSYLLRVVSLHLQIYLQYILCFSPHLHARLLFAHLFSWLLLITAMCHDLNLPWSSIPCSHLTFLHILHICVLHCASISRLQPCDGVVHSIGLFLTKETHTRGIWL